RVEALKQMGVETVIGDIKDPESLSAAMSDIAAVISTASSTLSHVQGDSIQSVDSDGQLNVVRVATYSRVEKFNKRELIYTFLHRPFLLNFCLSTALELNFPNHRARVLGKGKNKIPFFA